MGSAEEGSMPISGKGATNQDAGFNSQDIDEFLRGFQSVKVHEEDDSRHREDSALQDVPSVAEHVNGKLKLMCSYGGRILPRPSDGKLRYVGGQTRIISIGMGVTFAELMQKLANAYGESLVIKYQLPDEELDSLVSVTCDEDLQNMIEEHVRISGSSDGGRIRLFLSSMGDQQYLDIPGDKQNSHQQYFEAINDVLESSFRNSRDNSSKALNELSEPSSSPKGQEGTNKAFMPTSVQDVTNPSLPPLAMPFSSEQLAQQDPLSFLPVSNTISLNQHTVQDAPSSSVFPTTVLPSSDQPLSSVPIPLPASLPSPLTAHTAQSGMALFTDIPTNGEGLNYSSQSDLPYRFSEPVVSETSFQTHSAFSAPLDHREKLHGLDQQLNDVKLPIDHHEKLSQLQEKHELPQTIIDSRFDAQSLSNLKPIISEPLSSAVQPPWHETEKMQQLPQQNSTLVNLSSQQAANIGTANFRHAGTQGQVLSDSMLNDLHNVLSSQQTGHYIASADPTSLGFSVQPTYNYNDSLLYGEPVYNYNGQNGGVFGSPGTAAGYGTVSSEQGAPPSLFSNEQHYGMQSMLSNKQSSSPNEVFHQHASVSRYPESIPQVVQTTYERADVIQMPAYPGLNTMQDEMVSFNPFENDNAQGGGGNQQGKETDRMSPGLQHYTVSSVPAEYVPPSALYPYYHETAARIGETDPKIMEAGPRNQHISHGTGNDSIIQSKESYFDTHNTVEDSAAGGAEEKNLMNHAELLPPLSETLNASEYTRHMKDMPPSSYGNRALEPNSNAISQTEYPVRLPSSVVPPDDHLDAYAPNERNMIFGDVQGKVPEEKIQSPKEDCAVGGISEASRKPSLESKNNVVDDAFIQWSHMQPKSPSNTSLDAEGAKKSSTTDVAVIPEMVKPSDGLVSLLPEVPSSGSLPKSVPASSTALTDLSKLVPSLPGDTSLALSHAADFSCESLEEKNSTSLDLKHLTTEAAFQSPVPHSLGVSNGGVELEGAEADNEEESNIDGSDNDNPVSDAYIAEFEAVARGLQVIKNADLEELQELGSGTFGTVYHGKWKGTDVAIKRIKNSCFTGRPSEQEHMRADFWSEATLLAKLHHPNILAFYGVVPDGPGGTLGTVTEYMINGSLKHVLQRKDRPIDHRKRVLIAMDAAFGMEYLHSKNIVHFDLKCENLLVNMRDAQRPICKVGDFGLSKIKHQTFVSGGVRGTLPWIAPELLNGSSHMVSEKVDVYSFGIVMWELLTGEEPYANMHYGAIIGGIVSNTLRPSVPDNCDPHWRALMEACWSCEPTARPAFTEVVSKLRAMSATLPTKGQGQKQT